MANNVLITPGSGDTVAAEDIAAVKYQRVKLIDATAASTSGAGIAANPLQVSLANTAANATAVKVDGSAVTQPVSAGSLPLPAGASTAAKQPALGIAGTASADIITVQGIAGMTKLLVTPDSVALPANQSVNIAQVNGVTVLVGNGAAGTGSLRATISNDNTAIANWGQGATAAAVPAGAEYQGVLAQTALPTAATAGNLVGTLGDKFGRQLVIPQAFRDLVSQSGVITLTNTTETTLIAAVASVFLDLVEVVASNTSATAVRLDIRDSTGGTIRHTLYLPSGDVRGFVLQVPTPQATVNTNWTVQLSASVTDVRITAKAIQNK